MGELLKFLGLSATVSVLITGIIGYLGQKIIEQILSKDLEKFKDRLESENQKSKIQFEKEIESYKAGLDIANIRQSKLYTKRIDIIEELYQKLVVFQNSMLDMTLPFREITGKDKKEVEKEELERVAATTSLGNDFLQFYQKNKIYFDVNICELVDKIQTGLKQSHNDYSFQHFGGVPLSKLTDEMAKNASESVRTDIPLLIEALEHEFRKSIGVIEK